MKKISIFLVLMVGLFLNISNVRADDEPVVEKKCAYEKGCKIITFDIGTYEGIKYDVYRLNEEKTTTGKTIEAYSNKIINWAEPDDVNNFIAKNFIKRNDKCPKYFLDGSFHNRESWFAYSKEEAKKLQKSLDYDTELYTRYSAERKKACNPDKEKKEEKKEQKDDIQAVCGILTKNAQDFIYRILDWIKYIALILTVALSILDFFKAMSSEEDDSFKKAASKLAKRIIIVVLLFILPVLLEFVLKLVHIQGVEPGNPLCM